MTKMFRERNTFVLGLGFILTVSLIVLAALRVTDLIDLQGRRYYANVAEAGGLKAGDAVRVNGVKVGRVTDIRLAERGVKVTFAITNNDVEVGDKTTAAIKVATVLGDKELALVSAGDGELPERGTIPLERTRAPYDVSTALNELTTEVGRIDTQEVATALDAVSTTLEGAPVELQEALDGVQALSRTLNARDAQILTLANRAEQFTGILADRSVTLRRLVGDGNLLFAELTLRERAIVNLLANITPLARQLRGLVQENETDIGPALDDLNEVAAILRANRTNIRRTLLALSDYATGLGEAVGSGRFFTAKIQNLLPGNLVPSSPGDLLDLLDSLGLSQRADEDRSSR
jgi:phospholipid/cholesterol/gamma-HCH transport system substrate-binding protein